MKPSCGLCFPSALTVPRPPSSDYDGEPNPESTISDDASTQFPGR